MKKYLVMNIIWGKNNYFNKIKALPEELFMLPVVTIIRIFILTFFVESVVIEVGE